MKRIVTVLLVTLIMIVLVGCGAGGIESKTAGKSELDLEAMDEANLRAAIAGLTASLLMEDVTEEEIQKNNNDTITYGIYEDGSGLFAEVIAMQKQDGWQNASEQFSNAGKDIGGTYVPSSTTGWRLTANLIGSEKLIVANSLD